MAQRHPRKHHAIPLILVGFLVTSLAIGVVVAGVAMPVAALVGLTARDTSSAIEKLPQAFETGTLAMNTNILDADGGVIATLFDQNRVYRPLDQIARTMIEAIVSIEDHRFYQHGAIDLEGTLRALITNQANDGVTQGGSSITQQLVKQVLYNAATTPEEKEAAIAPSYERKIKELRYAIALEQQHDKNWILEQYLNIAYFGDGAYGVQAAAQHYFSVNASELTYGQAALLAGLVQQPNAYDPTVYPDAAISRRNVVIDRMASLSVITRSEAETLKKADLGLKLQSQFSGCVSSYAAFFCDFVVNYLMADPDLGATADDRHELLYSGGLTVKTPLRPANQQAANESVAKHVYAKDNAVGGLAEVDPRTGDVITLAQSRPMGNTPDTGETYINYTVPAEWNGAVGFQAGSTFKVFTLAAAINQGITMTTKFDAQDDMEFDLTTFANCPGEPGFGGPKWKVNNATQNGIMDFYTGTRQSVNTFYVQVEQKTGVCAPYELAQSMGVQLTDPEHERLPAFTLGIVDVTPLEMAGAYGTFGNLGVYCKPRPVLEVLDSAGKTVKSYDPDCSQVVPERTASVVNDILRGVQEPGGFGGAAGTTLYDADKKMIPCGGKTGTTDSARSVWYMGYCRAIATASMIAGADQEGHPVTLRGQTIAGSYVGGATGGTVAAPMWRDAMQPIKDSIENIPFNPPDTTITQGAPTFPDPVPSVIPPNTIYVQDPNGAWIPCLGDPLPTGC